MPTSTKGEGKTDLNALAAQLASEQAALAERILAQLGTSSSSSKSSPAKPALQPRPPTLGLGAALPTASEKGAVSARGDARLRGALTGGVRGREMKRQREEEAKLDAGKAKEEEEAAEEEEEEDIKGKGVKSALAKRKEDPFAPKAKKQKRTADPTGEAEPTTNGNASTSAAPAASNEGRSNANAAVFQAAEAAAKAAGDEAKEKGESKKAQKRARKAARDEVLKRAGLAADGAGESNVTVDSAKVVPNGAPPSEKGDEEMQDAEAEASPSVKADSPPAQLSKAERKKLKAAAASSASQPAAAPAAPIVMTALQSSAATKLAGARFRSINEDLYTSRGADAIEAAEEDPSRMDAYHAGFRAQVTGWPLVPVRALAALLVGAAARKGGKGRFAAQPVVLDLGAGEAPLARALAEKGERWRVLSFDLLDSPDGWVRQADVSRRLPLPGGSGGEIVDVAVFSLALMGTDWVNMLREARRCLRDG